MGCLGEMGDCKCNQGVCLELKGVEYKVKGGVSDRVILSYKRWVSRNKGLSWLNTLAIGLAGRG